MTLILKNKLQCFKPTSLYWSPTDFWLYHTNACRPFQDSVFTVSSVLLDCHAIHSWLSRNLLNCPFHHSPSSSLLHVSEETEPAHSSGCHDHLLSFPRAAITGVCHLAQRVHLSERREIPGMMAVFLKQQQSCIEVSVGHGSTSL